MSLSTSSLRRHVPTVLTGIALTGLFWWGHSTGWRLARPIAETPHTATDNWCPEHHVPEEVCLLCRKVVGTAQIEHEPARHRAVGEEVRFAQVASAEALSKAGVEVATVAEEAVAPRVRIAGETMYPPTAVARLGTRSDGMVHQVLVRLGDTVAPGTVVAMVEAATSGRAKSALMMALTDADLARRHVERLRTTAAAGILSAAALDEAEAHLRTAEVALFDAEQSLRNLGLPVDVAELEGLTAADLTTHLRRLGLPDDYADGGSANLLPIVAPHAGVVTEIRAVAGEAVATTDTIVVIAGQEELWLALPLSADHTARIAPDQAVRFTATSGQEASGTVLTVARAADPQTRLVTAWAVVDQPDEQLRSGQFGTATITTGASVTAAIVPPGAVQFDGAQPYVFVRRSETIFRALPVRILARDGERIAVDRLQSGDEVAVSGTGILFSAAYPERMGAGCTDD